MSSPIVMNGKLYTYTRDGEVPAGDAAFPTLAPGPMTQEALVCLDTKDGKVLWKHIENMIQTDVPVPPPRLVATPSATPAPAGSTGSARSATLVCLDGDSGKVVWQRQMTEEFGLISTFGGRTPSPAIDEDQVFVGGVAFGWGDNARGQHRIFAFDKNTGELNWTAGTGGIPVDAPQNTPVIAVINGERLVIFAAGDGGIHAFQARTGKKVWTLQGQQARHEHLRRRRRRLRLLLARPGQPRHEADLGRVFCLDIGTTWRTARPRRSGRSTGIEAALPHVLRHRQVALRDGRPRAALPDGQGDGQDRLEEAAARSARPRSSGATARSTSADGNGKFMILKPGDNKAEKVLSKIGVPEKIGREYAIYGSPAICDGRVYLQTATKIYCIGKKDAKADRRSRSRRCREESPAGDTVARVLVRAGGRGAARGAEAEVPRQGRTTPTGVS